MLQAQKAIRVHNLAMAFRALAKRPDDTLDVAVLVDDDVVEVIESNLHKIAAKLNGAEDSVGAEIEAWLNPAGSPLEVVRAKDVAAVENGLPRFPWKAIQTPGAALGDLNGAFECRWGGLHLKIVKRGPADYEGLIDGQHFARSKFKKNMRERLEKEAARRANA